VACRYRQHALGVAELEHKPASYRLEQQRLGGDCEGQAEVLQGARGLRLREIRATTPTSMNRPITSSQLMPLVAQARLPS